MRQPFGVRGHRVKFMPVHHQQAPAIGGLVDGVLLDGNISENAQKISQKFVVIAGDENNVSPFAGFAEQFLNNIVVRLRPIMFPAQPPEIHDIAHKVQLVKFCGAQKLQQAGGITAACAEMQI